MKIVTELQRLLQDSRRLLAKALDVEERRFWEGRCEALEDALGAFREEPHKPFRHPRGVPHDLPARPYNDPKPSPTWKTKS